MKKILFFASSLLVLALYGSENKSLVIMIDGMRADTPVNIAMPDYNALKAGKFAGGYKVVWSDNCRTVAGAPADSAPNHVAIATGVNAGKHGVLKNGLTKDGKYSEYPFYLTRLFKNGKIKKGAFFYSWGEDAQIKAEGTEYCNKGDAGNVAEVIALLGRNDTPDALHVYIDEPDHDGHSRGKVMGLNSGFYPYGQKYTEGIKLADKWIGEILSAILKRPSFDKENWYIVICADHGGYEYYHGKNAGDHAKSVPLLVISKKFRSNGKLAGVPSVTDIAPSILDHFGMDIAGMDLDGRVIDGVVAEKKRSLKDKLVYSLDFDKKLTDNPVSAEKVRISGKVQAAAGGKFGSAVSFNGDGGFLQLVDSNKLAYDKGNEFTVSFWLKSDKSSANPVFFGNKSRNDINGAGLFMARNGTYFLNIGSADKKMHKNIERFAHLDQWLFFAVTVKDGAVYFAQGMPDGNFYFMSVKTGSLNMINSAPWILGQEGDFRMDDFALWSRGLNMSELKKIFDQGCRGVPLKGVIEAYK